MQSKKETRGRSDLAALLARHPRRFLWLFTAWYLLAEVCLNLRRPFWFDELVAGSLAGVPRIGQIWELIERGIELNPPLTFWIQWAVAHTLGRGELVSRLPSILGFWLMCLCLYHFVRRRTDAAYGFVALLFPVFTYTSWYGTYARGYGLMLGCSAAALLSWQYAAEGVHRRRALVLLALSVAGIISSHYYGLYVVGAIGLGEITRSFGRRKAGRSLTSLVDWGVWTALAAGLTPLAIYFPLIRSTAGAARTFWVPAELGFIADCYTELFGVALLVFLVWQWYAVTGSEREPPEEALVRREWPRHEAVACLVLLAMPLALGVAAQFIPIAFYKFYVQPVAIGAAVVLALFVHRVTAGSRRMRSITFGLLVWGGFLPWGLFQISKLALMPAPQEIAAHRFDKLLAADPSGQLPLVVDNNAGFLMLYHYAPAELRERLFLLSDKRASVEFLGSDTALRSLELMNTLEPVHLGTLRDFVAAHDEFLVALPNAESWIVQKLLADGVPMELAAYQKGLGPFAEEMFVFRAHAARGLTSQRLGR